MSDRVDKILSFLKEIEDYKTIERHNIVPNLNRPESDAEHSWHLSLFLMLFNKDLPEDLDTEKMLKMSLIHDLIEIYAGDVFAFKENKEPDRDQKELQAAKRLFSQLPSDLEEQLLDLFQEYEAGETEEARIVESFDKLQPILQNIAADGRGWEEYDVSYSEVDEYKRDKVRRNELLKDLYERLMDSAEESGLLPREN